MTPTPQPKLTPEQIYEILDAATYHDADVAEIESVRTAVAQIIAERDQALRAIERKDYCMVNIRARLDPVKMGLSVEELTEAITYTGTEE